MISENILYSQWRISKNSDIPSYSLSFLQFLAHHLLFFSIILQQGMPGILKQKGSVTASRSNWEIICPTWLLPSLLQFCKHEITLKKNKKIHLHFYVIFMNFIIKNMELFKRWRAVFWNAKFSRDSLVYKNHLSHMRRIEVRTFIWIGTELDTAAPLDTQHLVSCATSFHPC